MSRPVSSTILLALLGVAGCASNIRQSTIPQVECHDRVKVSNVQSAGSRATWLANCPKVGTYACERRDGATQCQLAEPRASRKTAAAKPPTAAEQMKRELSSLEAGTALQGDGWSMMVPGKASPPKRDGDGPEQFDVNFGAATEATCFLHPGVTDPGQTMRRVLQTVSKSVKMLQLVPVEVTHGGDLPVMVLRAVYSVQQGGERATGHLKLGWIHHPLRPALCMHDDAGYEVTFGKVMVAMAADFSVEAYEVPAEYEVFRLAVNDLPVGFSLRLERQNGALRTAANIMTMAIPTARGELKYTDYADSTVVDGEREVLLEGTWVGVVNGAVERKLVLGPLKDGKHPLTGTLGGKPVDRVITPPKGGISVGFPDARLAALRSPRPFEFSRVRFDAASDAPGLKETHYRHPARVGVLEKLKDGKVATTLVFDPAGHERHLTSVKNGIALTGERLVGRYVD